MIRAVIVDDEAPARRRLRRLVEDEPDVVVVSECADGDEAVRAVTETRPDLLFLDIRMPEMGGLEVLKAIGPDRVPAVVLVTALGDHALEAFDLRALDYLVKPFTRARFAEAMARVRRLVRGGVRPETRDKHGARLGEGDSGAPQDTRRSSERGLFPVRAGGRLILLRQREVVRVEGAGRYIRIHTDDDEHLQRGSLTDAVEELDPRRFMRVHNSHIVNLERVREIQPHGHGDYRLLLDDGSVVPVSRSHADRLKDRLGV
ncbi:MAG: LytR/AlgR family response regulator transcription factor [Gemmatimonadota bacterium]